MYICIYLKVSHIVLNGLFKRDVTPYQWYIHSCSFWLVFAAKESFGGMRLLRRADFNAGAHINTFWRMPCRGALDTGSKKSLTWDNKHITWFGKTPVSHIWGGGGLVQWGCEIEYSWGGFHKAHFFVGTISVIESSSNDTYRYCVLLRQCLKADFSSQNTGTGGDGADLQQGERWMPELSSGSIDPLRQMISRFPEEDVEKSSDMFCGLGKL